MTQRTVIQSKTTHEYCRKVKEEYFSLFTNAEWQVLIESLSIAMDEWDVKLSEDELIKSTFFKLQCIKQMIESIEYKNSLK